MKYVCSHPPSVYCCQSVDMEFGLVWGFVGSILWQFGSNMDMSHPLYDSKSLSIPCQNDCSVFKPPCLTQGLEVKLAASACILLFNK